MSEPAQLSAADQEACTHISEMLARVGDTWSIQTVRALRERPLRFNALRRRVGGISQKMLTVTLRRLERDGLVQRTVRPTTPPQVEYALTEMGDSLQAPVCALVSWTLDNANAINAARDRYDALAGSDASGEALRTTNGSTRPLAAVDGRALSGS